MAITHLHFFVHVHGPYLFCLYLLYSASYITLSGNQTNDNLRTKNQSSNKLHCCIFPHRWCIVLKWNLINKGVCFLELLLCLIPPKAQSDWSHFGLWGVDEDVCVSHDPLVEGPWCPELGVCESQGQQAAYVMFRVDWMFFVICDIVRINR